MKPKPVKRHCRIERGTLYWSDGTERNELQQRKLLAAALRGLPDGGYVWALEPVATTRTLKANAWLWGVVYKLIAEETGYTVDQVHEVMKQRHNGERLVDPGTGEEFKIGKSTAKLTIEQFSDYIDAVMLDGAEWCGIVWPEPAKSEDWRAPVKRGKAA